METEDVRKMTAGRGRVIRRPMALLEHTFWTDDVKP
jgi:hypothetical protein